MTTQDERNEAVDFVVQVHARVRVHARDETEAAQLVEQSLYHWQDWRLEDHWPVVVVGTVPKGAKL